MKKRNKAVADQTNQLEYAPCKVEKMPGESLVSFSNRAKELFPFIVRVLELEHEAIDASQPHIFGEDHLAIIRQDLPGNIDGQTWEQIIQMYVLKQEGQTSSLRSHVRYESTPIHFIASSSRITYTRRLALHIHEMFQHAEQVRDISKALEREDILRFVPVHNVSPLRDGCTLGILVGYAHKKGN